MLQLSEIRSRSNVNSVGLLLSQSRMSILSRQTVSWVQALKNKSYLVQWTLCRGQTILEIVFNLVLKLFANHNDIIIMTMNPQQNNFITTKSKHYRKHLPKGSYHSYCRNRIYESHPQEFLRQDLTRLHPKTSQTQRQKHTPLDSALTFEEYLLQIQRPNTTAIEQINKRDKSKDRNRGVSQAKQNLRKIDNEQIIDSHLPFFKCKLEKTEFLIKRPDFRVKEQKFKMNRNVVQNNLYYFMSQSMPLRRT